MHRKGRVNVPVLGMEKMKDGLVTLLPAALVTTYPLPPPGCCMRTSVVGIYQTNKAKTLVTTGTITPREESGTGAYAHLR